MADTFIDTPRPDYGLFRAALGDYGFPAENAERIYRILYAMWENDQWLKVNGGSGIGHGLGLEACYAVFNQSTIPTSKLPNNAWPYQQFGTSDGLTWHTNQQSVSETNPYGFVCHRVTLGELTAGDVVQEAWSPPGLNAKWSEDGTDGTPGTKGDKGDPGARGEQGLPGEDFHKWFPFSYGLPYDTRKDEEPGTSGGGNWRAVGYNETTNSFDAVTRLQFSERDASGINRRIYFESETMQRAGRLIGIRRDANDQSHVIVFKTTSSFTMNQDANNRWYAQVDVSRQSTQDSGTISNITPALDTEFDLNLVLPNLTTNASLLGGREPGWFYANVSATLATLMEGLTDKDTTPWTGLLATEANKATPGDNLISDTVTLYRGSIAQTRTWDGSSWVAFANVITGNLLVPGTVVSEKIAALAITAAKIAANTITAAQIAANTITANEIASNTITASEIAATTITAAQIALATITDAQIAATTITGSKIALSTITGNNIASTTITGGKIATNTIEAGNIKANAIESGKIKSGAVTADKINAGAVTADKIGAGAVTAGKLAANSVTANNIVSGSVTAAKIASDFVSTIRLNANQITAGTIAADRLTADVQNVKVFWTGNQFVQTSMQGFTFNVENFQNTYHYLGIEFVVISEGFSGVFFVPIQSIPNRSTIYTSAPSTSWRAGSVGGYINYNSLTSSSTSITSFGWHGTGGSGGNFECRIWLKGNRSSTSNGIWLIPSLTITEGQVKSIFGVKQPST